MALGTVRSSLALVGALVGAGSVVGLTHAAPSLLRASGVTCKPIGEIVGIKELSRLGTNRFIKWGKDQYSRFPQRKDAGGANTGKDVCYRR